MKRLRYLDPRRWANAIKGVRAVADGGGPKTLRLVAIGRPRGWLIPSSEVVVEIEAHDGSSWEFRPALPVPFPYAWAYRVAVAMNVPFVSDLKPETFGFEVGVPTLSS